MKFERKKIAVALAYALGAGSTLLIAAPSQAADISVSVTGSNIRRTDIETASPVQVITEEQLKNSGYTTISEVLRDITANGQGMLSQGFNGAFAGGASGVALRGLTVGATLVLIDGRRMVGYPLADDGQRNFVDISSIPFSAVERVEVLLDGASAIYGSDAIGGVVNVILKKNFTGTELVAEGGMTFQGDGGNVHAAATTGFGGSGPYNGLLSVEYRHQNAIKFKSRDDEEWANMNWSGFGGNDLRPGAKSPIQANPVLLTPYLQRPGSVTSLPENNIFLDSRCTLAMRDANQCLYENTWSVIQPETQNFNVLGRFNADLGSGWRTSLTGSYFYSEAAQDGRPFGVPAGSTLANPASGPNQTPTLVNGIPVFLIPADYPGNTFGVPALARALVPQISNQRTDYETGTLRLVGELDGSVAGWDVNLAGGYQRAETDVTANGYVDYNVLLAELNNPVNRFLLTGGNSPEQLARIAPTVKSTKTNELDFVQLTASRDVMKLDGGMMGVALGGSWIYQDLDADNPSQCKDGTVAGLNCFFAVGDQTNTAFFAEINAPVLKSLELNGAIRYDHYDTYSGGQWTPKVGAKWTPLKEVAVRGTWGKGFRAPSVMESGNAGLAYGAGSLRDTLNCPVDGPDGEADLTSPQNAVFYCQFNPTFQQSSNPDLDPEKSTNWTVGLVLEPIANWSTTVDYYSIKIKNQIFASSYFSSFDPLALAVRDVPQSVTFGDGRQGPSPAGIIAYIADTYVNARDTTTTGLDFGTAYAFKLPDASQLKLGAQWSHIFKYDTSFEGNTYKLAGTHGPSIISGNTGTPKDRIQLTGEWIKGPFTATLTGNYVSSFNLTDPAAGIDTCFAGAATGNGSRFSGGSTIPDKYCTVDSFWYFNLNLTYQANKQTQVRLAVTNLFNNQAPVELGTYSSTGENRTSGRGAPYNPQLHWAGVQGASWLLGLTYTF